MTHAELVRHAERWLRGTARCSVVFTEMRTYGYEIPDAIGWKSIHTFLIECKVSRADFHADRGKFFRSRNPEMGMGHYRYFMVPDGLVHPREVLPAWGLIYVTDRGRFQTLKKASRFNIRNVESELDMCRSWIRRHETRYRATWMHGRGEGI